MGEKFNEYSNTGAEIERTMELMMKGVESWYKVRFKEPHHDIARRFLNEISEFEPEAVQDQKARLRAAREVRENADKSGG